jgi:fumarate reductase flavoprotein subunit
MPALPADESNTTDLIVVGAGGSGLATAVSAAQHGLSVIVLEKCPQPGGTTAIAIGSFTANRTRFQERQGIKDSAADHAHDAGLFAAPEIEQHNDAGLREYFLEEAHKTLDWLIEMGVRFHGPFPEPPNRVPRMHNVIPNARSYILTLVKHLRRRGGRIVCEARVNDLIVENGRVSGVRATVNGEEQEFLSTRGVVLAAGDYANSPELISRFKGEGFSEIEGINTNATGDGHLLAERAGAKLLNMPITYGPELRFVPPPVNRRPWVARLPASGWIPQTIARLLPYIPQSWMRPVIKRLLVTWQHPEDALFDDGAILINRDGKRFCDETTSPQREIALAQQPGKIGYLLLDERLIERYSAWPHFISTAPEIAYAYVADYLKLRPDIAVAAERLERLAAKTGIPGDALQQTVHEWNRTAESPMDGNRWVLLGPVKAWFTTTEGGAAVNRSLQVLDGSGTPIPGLYAVGQNGLGGMILWGHGLHIAWALTSGRLCGEVLGNRS